MDWLTRLERLSQHQLKNLAFLCGGVAVLILVALGVSGNLPGFPDYLKFALQNAHGVSNTAALFNWTQQTGSGGNNWSAVTSSADASHLAAVTASGYIYTSADGGVNWVQQTTSGSRFWEAITSSVDGTRLAAFWGPTGTIYFSTTAGTAWTQATTSGTRAWSGVASSADGTKLVAVADGDFIYTSTNGGYGPWVQRATSKSWYGVSSSADGTRLVAGNQSGAVYYSTNSGVTWTTSADPDAINVGGVVSSSDGMRVAGFGSGGYIVTSSDGGVTWTRQDAAGVRSWKGLTSSADGRVVAAVELSGYVYVSRDYGVTWERQIGLGSHSWGGGLSAVAVSSDGTKLAAAEEGGGGFIYTTTYAGSCKYVWTQRMGTGSQWLGWAGIASSYDGSKLAAAAGIGAGTGSIYTSTDSGLTWVERTDAGSRYWEDVASSADGGRLIAASTAGAYRSLDSGATWAIMASAGDFVAVASSIDGLRLAGVKDNGNILTSSDVGTTWVTQSTAGVRRWTDIAMSTDGMRLAATAGNGTNDYIYTSIDAGLTWTQRTTAGLHSWEAITSSADGSKLAANYSGNGNTRISTDSGVTWSDGIPVTAQDAMASSYDGSKIIGALNSTPGFSTRISNDSGVHWQNQSDAALGGTHAVSSSADGMKLAVAGHYPFGSNNFIYTSTCNYPPEAPTLVAPSSGYTNTLYSLSASSTDFNNDVVTIGVDWNNNGSVDQWFPGPITYIGSGATQFFTHSWSANGIQPFGLVAKDSAGNISATTSAQISISPGPSGSPTGSITGISNCSSALGTASDPDNATAVQVGIYADGPWGGGGSFIASTTATGGNFNQSLMSFPSLQDTNQHSLYVYARNNPTTSGVDVLLSGSPLVCKALPTVTLSHSPVNPQSGSTVTLSWSSNSGSITYTSLKKNGVVIESNSAVLSSLSYVSSAPATPGATDDYQLSYTFSNGSGQVQQFVTAASPLPSSISFTSTKVRKGFPSTLTWNISGMSDGITCSISPGVSMPTWNHVFPWQGNISSPPVNVTTRFTLSCGNGMATTTKSTTATLLPTPQEI